MEKAFIKALQNALLVVEKKSVSSVLSKVMLESKKGQLFVKAANLKTYFTAIVPARINQEFKFLVEPKDLLNTLKSLRSFSIDYKDEKLLIKNDKSEYVFDTYAVYAFPEFPSLPYKNGIKLSFSLLSNAIKKVSYAVANEPDYKLLDYLYVHDYGKSLRFIGSDGLKLGMYEFSPFDEKVEFFIPKSALKIFEKGLFNSDKVTIVDDRSYLYFLIANTIIAVKKPEGEYADYVSVFERLNPRYKIFISKSKFIEVLKKFYKEKSTHSVFILFSPSKAVLSAEDKFEEIPIEFSLSSPDEEILLEFRLKDLIDVLSSFDRENVEVHVEDERSPVLLKAKEPYCALIMPVV